MMPRRAFLGAAAAFVVAACTRDKTRSAAPAATTTTSASSPTTSTTAAPSGPAEFVTSGPPAGNKVALTFHGSGDVALLRSLLDAARSASVPLTIFAVGNWLDANPQVAKLILDGGHELANHTYTHPTLPKLGRAAVAAEIAKCRDALARHAGEPGRWFRPSGTPAPNDVIREEAAKAGYRTVVGYDVDPLDYQDPGAKAVAAAVKAGVRAGSIVSLHTGHAGTVEAFPAIVQALHDAKLTAVRLRDLLP
jgi:peptidoglycan/xylan/chitin deacetylase (PgdA/CDA1 family)